MFTKIASSARPSIHSHHRSSYTPRPSCVSNDGGGIPNRGTSTGELNVSGVEQRILSVNSIRALENATVRLDKLVEQFLERYKEYEHDVTGLACIDAVSSCRELDTFINHVLDEIPELDATIRMESAKLTQVSELSDGENNLDPALQVVTHVYTLFYQQSTLFLGPQVSPLEDKLMEIISKSAFNLAPPSDEPPPSPQITEPISCKPSGSAVEEKAFVEAERWLLKCREKGLLRAFDMLETFNRYLKDTIVYIDKKIQLDIDYCARLTKISQYQGFPSEEEGSSSSHLPLWTCYSFLNSKDREFCNSMMITLVDLQGRKFVDSLKTRRVEFEEMKREIRITWEFEEKEYMEAQLAMKKAKDLYWQREADRLKKEQDTQDKSQGENIKSSEKKKNAMKEAEFRSIEAFRRYEELVNEANAAQEKIQEERKKIMSLIKNLLVQAEKKVQSATMNYFRLMASELAPRGTQYQSSLAQSVYYQPGRYFGEQLIRIFEEADGELVPFPVEPFAVEYFNKPSTTTDSKTKKVDRLNASTSPRVGAVSSAGINHTFQQPSQLTEAARTHSFTTFDRNDPDSSCCLECHQYPYQDPYVCKHCHGIAHLSCLEHLSISCAQVKQLENRRRLKFFRRLPSEQPCGPEGIPWLLTRAIERVEQNFLADEGLYRKEGSKAKVQQLCQEFEDHGEKANLRGSSAIVLTSMLKHYLRVLPDPLMSSQLHQEWLALGKMYKDKNSQQDQMVAMAKSLYARVPKSYQPSSSYLLAHLRRVADRCDDNKMGASNLAVVFGPTLIRKQNAGIVDPLSLQLDAQNVCYLSAVIELFIDLYSEIFSGLPGPPAIKHLNEEDGDFKDDKILNVPSIDDEISETVSTYTSSINQEGQQS